MNHIALEKIAAIDFTKLEKEILRELRGKKSQGQVNKFFNFNYNKVAKWEAGEQDITWSEFLKYTEWVENKDLKSYFKSDIFFHGDILNLKELTSHCIQNLPIDNVAITIGCSKATIYRWLKGETEPNLIFILKMIFLTHNNILIFLSHFGNIEDMTSIAPFVEMEKSKDIFMRYPLIAAILRIFELESYESLPKHKENFIAQKLNISIEEERFLLGLMLKHQFIALEDNRYISLSKSVDTRGDKKLLIETKLFWHGKSREILESLLSNLNEASSQESPPHIWGHNVACVTEATKDLITKKTLSYYNDIVGILSSEMNRGQHTDVILLSVGVQSILNE